MSIAERREREPPPEQLEPMLARAGRLSPADVAVSMVTITLFIPCIANVFMIGKERGWKVAGAMSAFIFPYAVLVGGIVRLLFNALPFLSAAGGMTP